MSGSAKPDAPAGCGVTDRSSVTRQGTESGQVWRFLEPSKPSFNPGVFNDQWLTEQGILEGAAAAGRGNTFFFTLDNHALVLRHYRRGGFARKISSRRYWFAGMSRTRAMREFDVLVQLQRLRLPAPVPYACQVVRSTVTYEASLVTHRISGQTLAHQLQQQALTVALWQAIGVTLARFHKAGIYHADLNAHNILLDNVGGVFVIDFDRARIRPVPEAAFESGWCVDNMNRLERSVRKVVTQSGRGEPSELADERSSWQTGFSQLRECWATGMKL